MNRLRSLILAPLVLGLASCGDAGGPSGTGCDVLSAVEISSGTTPTFNWSPSCGIAELTIRDETETDPDKKLKWDILAEQNLIRPSVSYGSTPANATQTQAPEPLIASTGSQQGHTYSLTMSVIQEDGTFIVVALQLFNP